MAKHILLSIIFLTLLVFVLGAGTRRRDGSCSWTSYYNSSCSISKFLCANQKCIDRKFYCNGNNDCGDNSDENCYNYYNGCEYLHSKIRCGDICIPSHWYCDGILDCNDGTDEKYCDSLSYSSKNGREYIAKVKGLKWLYQQSKSNSLTERWGSQVDKFAVALYLANPSFSIDNNGTRKEIAYELTLQLLSRLYRTKLHDISSADLASFVNAFLVSCLDPRKFQGMNIVQELRNRVDRQNFTNPYVLLSLCNAGEKITERDTMKLIDTFRNKHREFWTDMQAVAVMALACASKQPENDVDVEKLYEFTMELKQHQFRNGSVENLQTTALVMQALLSVERNDDPENFDEGNALEQMISCQESDGSFGSLKNTYFVLPVLNCKSLMNISSDHCQYGRRDETSALINLSNERGARKRVQYSLWIGTRKDLEKNLVLRVPLNMSFYDIMEVAAEIDNRYSFEYVVKNRKPYVNSISGIQDDPEDGKFWFLYTMKESEPIPVKESPADERPKDNDHYVMWYRSGSWID